MYIYVFTALRLTQGKMKCIHVFSIKKVRTNTDWLEIKHEKKPEFVMDRISCDGEWRRWKQTFFRDNMKQECRKEPWTSLVELGKNSNSLTVIPVRFETVTVKTVASQISTKKLLKCQNTYTITLQCISYEARNKHLSLSICSSKKKKPLGKF